MASIFHSLVPPFPKLIDKPLTSLKNQEFFIIKAGCPHSTATKLHQQCTKLRFDEFLSNNIFWIKVLISIVMFWNLLRSMKQIHTFLKMAQSNYQSWSTNHWPPWKIKNFLSSKLAARTATKLHQHCTELRFDEFLSK